MSGPGEGCDKRSVLTSETMIPIGMVVSFVVFAFYVGGRVNAMETSVAMLTQGLAAQTQATTTLSEKMVEFRADLEQIDRDTEIRTLNRWTSVQMHRWARDYARRNPDADVPDVMDY